MFDMDQPRIGIITLKSSSLFLSLL